MPLNSRQKAVGKCPICGKHPDWFNDVPLRAFCWGTDKHPHEEMTRIVPGVAQPYGLGGKTKWMTATKFESQLTDAWTRTERLTDSNGNDL
jgi:hypothetical protein